MVRMKLKKIAVLIPCYNEELTINKVITDFKKELPDSEIYVYDNNSVDDTYNVALKAGATVKKEIIQGKGNVVRTMFSEIDADIYVLVDGDDTYPAETVCEMIDYLISNNADMVNGDRLSNGSYFNENKRKFHDFGNNIVRDSINILFHSQIKDVMTGYRVFSRRFVKNWPVMNGGFEIETEMTIHALDKRFKVIEYPIDYRDRPQGSESKLNTIDDGIKVVKTIIEMFKDYRPMLFFGLISLTCFIIGLLCGIPVVGDFLKFKYIYHIPLTVLAASVEILAMFFLSCGLILNTTVKIDKRNYELRLLDYKTYSERKEK